ncbi:MAG: gamma-glutamyl-gamma-aminobutyrate hydrolase family protein [Planctomycetota bacterium]
MTAPLIGITTYGRDESGKFALPAAYVDAVRRAGGIPVLVPPGEPNLDALLARLDGWILAGGGDLDPEHYGGEAHPTIYMVDPERDGSELALAKRLTEGTQPTLAICRGSQVVNVVLGGTLHEHLPDVVGEEVLHRLPPRQPTKHAIAAEPGFRLSAILGEKNFESASWHHQAVDKLGSGLDVVARAPDGTIEAFELRHHPWLFAVQWHPELTAAEDPVQQRLFDGLVRAAKARKELREHESTQGV